MAPLLTWFGFVCSLVPLLPFDFWLFALPDHFRIHYIVLSALALMFSCWFKQLKYSACLLCIVGLNLYVISPWDWVITKASLDKKDLTGASQSLIWMNVHTGNEVKQEVLDYLFQKDADIIILSEVNHRWIQSLEVLKPNWPYQILYPREDNFGMAAYSKFEFDSYSKLKLEAFDVPAIEMNLRSNDGNPISIIAVHPVPPIGKIYTQSRDAYILNLSRHMMEQKRTLHRDRRFQCDPLAFPVAPSNE